MRSSIHKVHKFTTLRHHSVVSDRVRERRRFRDGVISHFPFYILLTGFKSRRSLLPFSRFPAIVYFVFRTHIFTFSTFSHFQSIQKPTTNQPTSNTHTHTPRTHAHSHTHSQSVTQSSQVKSVLTKGGIWDLGKEKGFTVHSSQFTAKPVHKR